MAKWDRTCKEFNAVREQINSCDHVGVMESLHKICSKYAKEDDDFAYDFENLGEEIEGELEDKDAIREDDGIVDFYLNEFYDLCDAARIWLDI